MANEHIGRLRKIGLGKESTAGTAVAATDWLPKEAGGLTPFFNAARDKSSFGTIFDLSDTSTTKQKCKAKIDGVFRDNFGGHLLYAGLGTTYVCAKLVMSGGSGTFVVGESISQATSGATGTIRRVDGSAGSQTVYASITGGTFNASNVVTGGSSGATGTPTTFNNSVRTHLFALANTNTHPSYTIWESNPVETIKAAYGMIDTLEFELAIDDFLKFRSEWEAKKHATDTATPAFTTSQYDFVGRMASLKVASALSGLAAASAIDVAHIKLTIKKNLKDYQKFGSIDIQSQHNQAVQVTGEISAIFNATTYRDYVANSSKKAMRITLANTDVTIGSADNPTLQIDLAQVGFVDWGSEGGEDDLVMQKLGFEAIYSISDAEAIVALLQNTKTAAYDA